MTLPFQPSRRSTIGIEWELQLIDADSLDLRQCAESVMAAIGDEHAEHPNVHHELLLNTVELVSNPATTVSGAVADLERSIADITPVANELRVELATAGTHPFANPLYQRVTNKERYARLVDRTRYWGQQMLLFGLHVHVGIEDRDKVLPILRAVTARHGQLQALAASSPFWSNRDTGYASNRAMMFQQLPTAGLPYQFETWDALESYTDDLTRSGVITDFSEVRWDVRPSPKLGTIEVRICDAPTNLTELRALAALIHSMVEHYSGMLDRGEELPHLPQWYASENKWRSARYGMDATLILDERGTEASAPDTVRMMLDELQDAAARVGCAEDLALVDVILQEGASYDRQRRAHQRGGSMETVVGQLVREFQIGRPA